MDIQSYTNLDRKIRGEIHEKQLYFKKIGLFMMLFIVMGIAFLCLQSVNVYAEEIVEKDIQYEFAIDSVPVVMDEDISDINKVHRASYFTGIEISDIKDLTKKERNITSKNSDFRQILQIFLKKPSKENVLQAVIRLNEIEGVYSVEPNYY